MKANELLYAHWHGIVLNAFKEAGFRFVKNADVVAASLYRMGHNVNIGSYILANEWTSPQRPEVWLPRETAQSLQALINKAALLIPNPLAINGAIPIHVQTDENGTPLIVYCKGTPESIIARTAHTIRQDSTDITDGRFFYHNGGIGDEERRVIYELLQNKK